MDGRDFDITYTAGVPLGRRMRPEQRPPSPAFRLQPGERARLADDEAPRVQFAHWVHGIPPLRPSTRRGDRMPSRGGRRFEDIYLAEDDDYAGEIGLHFDGGVSGTSVNLRMADFAALQAAVTDPAKPVTASQVRGFLETAMHAVEADWGGKDPDVQAFRRVLRLLEDRRG